METTIQTIVSALNIWSSTIVKMSYESGFGIDGTLVPGTTQYEFPEAQIEWVNALAADRFPVDFNFGVATSAYQHEGAWNADGKGESVWDYMSHANPNFIVDRTNADVSSDSYYKYTEDVLLARNIGAKMYGISLSWPRLLPHGYNNYVNEDGVKYYNNLIDEMLENDIIPMITLFHWDLPYNLQQLGGWTNPIMPRLFQDYARTAFDSFGDRVKYWITISEPSVICIEGYGGDTMIPALNQSGIADYICAHNLLLAHAKVYHMYDKEYRPTQNGKVGIAHRYMWFVDTRNDSLDSVYADIWYNDWILHPIFSETGNYPTIISGTVKLQSKIQGFDESRLPSFTDSEIEELSGSADFLGINYFMPTEVYNTKSDNKDVNFENDAGIKVAYTEKWSELNSIRHRQEVLKDILLYVDKNYIIPEIFVTQNGCADSGGVIDINRITYHYHRISEVLEAMKEGVPVKGYLAWSLLDGFEWNAGYTQKYGIYQVDLVDPSHKRTPKLSAKLFTEIYVTKSMPKLLHFLNMSIVSSVLSLSK